MSRRGKQSPVCENGLVQFGLVRLSKRKTKPCVSEWFDLVQFGSIEQKEKPCV